jgi:hypothetical protein
LDEPKGKKATGGRGKIEGRWGKRRWRSLKKMKIISKKMKIILRIEDQFPFSSMPLCSCEGRQLHCCCKSLSKNAIRLAEYLCGMVNHQNACCSYGYQRGRPQRTENPWIAAS